MPRYSIDRATNFIIEEEAWTVVEYDHTSVPGVIYLSLTEGKINLIYDDIENGIADTDKIARYELLAPEEEQVFVVGQQINPIFTLTKNGSPIDMEVELIPENKNVAKFIDGVLTAVGEGETNIFVKLKNTSTVVNSLPIKVAEQREFSAYLNGADTIHLDREMQYELVGSVEISGEVVFFINNLELARIVKVENNTCVIHANDKNLLGSFILTATYDGKTYTKTITIIPLW